MRLGLRCGILTHQLCVGFGILLLLHSHRASPVSETSQRPGSSPESFRKKPLFCRMRPQPACVVLPDRPSQVPGGPARLERPHPDLSLIYFSNLLDELQRVT